MIVLDTTTRSLEIFYEAPKTTTEPDFVANWADTVSGGTFVPGQSNGATNGTTAVTMVAAPAASTQRMVKDFFIYNGDSVSHNFTVQVNDNGTKRILAVPAIAAGTYWFGSESISFTYAAGSGLTLTGYTFSIGANVAFTNIANSWTAQQTFNGAAGAYAIIVQGVGTAGNNFGLRIAAGVSSGDVALQVTETTNSSILFRIFGDGHIVIPAISTTASAANAYLDNSNSNNLLRSTSSIRYKTNVQYFGPAYSGQVVDDLKPVSFTSKASADDPTLTRLSFLAEDVAALHPSLVTWTDATKIDQTKPPPDGYATWAAYLTAHEQNGRVPDALQQAYFVAVLWSEVRALRAIQKPRTTAQLPIPDAAALGLRMFVTDAKTPAFGAVVVGGGTTPTPVYNDGTAWRVG